jgi:ABC-type sugar transport system substrate-binding protein
MGYVKHDAIIVTSWKHEAVEQAVAKAKEYGLDVLEQGSEVVNGYRTLLICPDGSKEGWETSNEFDAKREKYIEYLNSVRYEDGSSCLEWVAIAYGSDDQEAAITDHAWVDD